MKPKAGSILIKTVLKTKICAVSYIVLTNGEHEKCPKGLSSSRLTEVGLVSRSAGVTNGDLSVAKIRSW